MDERRKAQRVETNRPVRIIGGNRQVKGRLVSISLKGAGVESPARARPGTRLELIFDLPAGDRFVDLKLAGIVRTYALHNDKHLLGIEWEDPPEQALDAIQAFIDYKQRLHNAGVRGGGSYGAD